MKTTAILIPIILASTAHADITHIEDRRGANSILELFGNPGSVDPSFSDSTFFFYNDFNQVLNQTIDSSLADPIIGNASSSLTYESSISTTRFYSSMTASANATTLENGNIVFANTAFGNRVQFTLDQTTTFHIEGFLSSEANGGSNLVFSSVIDDGNVEPGILHLYAYNSTLEIDTFLTLQAGEYSYTTTSFSSASAIGNNQTDFGLAAHDITVTVIPTPASTALLFLAGSTLITRRRR